MLKFSLKTLLATDQHRFTPILLICLVWGLRAELTRWAENIDAGNRLENVFFRGTVRRPPGETRSDLSKLIAASPSDAELYSLRALEAEQALDFAAAEADWKKYIEVAKDKGAARIALADFYHRRLRSNDELTALAMAGRENLPDAEKMLPDSEQRNWKIYERLIKLVDDQRLESSAGGDQFAAWIDRYPGAAAGLYPRYFRFAMDHQRYDLANAVAGEYRRKFPKDEEFPIEAEAEIAAKIGTPARAIAVYESSFRPLWPAKLVTEYFDLLKQTGQLRAYLERARAGVAANPTDLASAVRLFYYWQQQGNAAAAERALVEFRVRKEARQSAWTGDELLTMARLFEGSHNYDEAARNYYALYKTDSMAEKALSSLARLLVSAPEQGISFGSGNLSLYRDVATMDPHPGFLNGVASLLLNDTGPPYRYATEEQSAAPYFRRARAAELVALFETRFPNSPERAELRERAIEAYAIYGSSDGVIQAGTKFLADFPNAPNRTAVAMRMADAYARLNRTPQEFATYDALLAELAKRAGGVPLGALPPAPAAGETAAPQFDKLRSPEYARVLDRYVARLVSMKRVNDALALYRREIDRNPNDPGLYDTLAAFLDQNKLGAEAEQVYKRAIAQFPDHTWEHKLARWYLRQRRQADVSRLTRDVIKTFSGTELEGYFREIVHTTAPVGPALALQLNVYAHQRFPHQLSFVRNLLAAYSAAPARNDVAYEALLRQHWYYAEDLRMRFFERLSRTGKLDAELAAARAGEQNSAAQRMLAEGEAWRGHFEAAAPLMLAIEKSFPADRAMGQRTAAAYRSLDQMDTAIAVEERLVQADPRDHAALTRLGEMEAARERFDRAAADWNRIAEIEPSKADSYLEAATVFWDYYRYDDALRLINEARQRLGRPALFAYEDGAIRENQRAYEFAAREYAKGAIAQPDSTAQQRLLSLARRPALRADIEQLTDNLVSARNPEMGVFHLRVALLRNQGRRDDLEKLLLDISARATNPELLAAIENDARVDGFVKAQQTSIERQVAVATDPVEKMRLRLGLARFFEGQGQTAQGAAVIDALYRENPAILGVVRAAVDYHWRNKNARRAVDVLEEAAGRAAGGYANGFTLESARKAAEGGDYARARGFAAKLLAASPENAEYVAAMADTYARQGDDRGLRTFYESKIHGENAPAMRRALIPVLTRMKDFSGAVDQYIEVLNKYPEDEGLAREAALYASANGVAAKLRDYYSKAANDSPKDYRWPMVLGRIETGLEDFPSAIAAYTRAAGVRPDRTDLLRSRLDLEVRTLRFEEAAATATKLYDLTYRNPVWMQTLAEIRARQGRNADAVAALQKAWIEGRSGNAANLLKVAEKLDQWGMITEARRFADQALKLSPDEEGLRVWVRIAMRQRDFDAALAKLAGLNDPLGMAVAVEIGGVVEAYYSPEEKMKFVTALEKNPRRVEVAGDAGLADVEAKWIAEQMMANPGDEKVGEWKEKLVTLQERRLAFDELGSQLEAYARAPGVEPAEELIEAASNYRASGNAAAELRVLQMQSDRAPLAGPVFDRFAQLLMAQPQRLVAAIARERRAEVANGLVNYAIEHGSAGVAQQAIAARGTRMGVLWTKSYTGLAGVYFATNTAPVRAAFSGILGDMTIGARIGKPVDRNAQLAGDLWFYHAGRFGEFARNADFLPAMVEANPGRSDGYFALAEYFRGAGNAAPALADYRGALELKPSRADVHDRFAVMAGSNEDAVKEWRLAIAALTDQMNSAHVPQTFWSDFNDTVHHIRDAKALPALRGDIDKLLRVYLRRNGAFQVEPLFEGLGDVAWIADLSAAAADPVRLLGSIIDRPWIPEGQKDVLYARMVESGRAQLARSYGEQRVNAQNELWSWEIQRAGYLLKHREDRTAAEVVAALREARKERLREMIPLELRVAARAGRLAAQLGRYDATPTMEILRDAATQLTKDGDAASARRVLEFAYSRELKAGNLDASNFVGLAEIRIEEKDISGAMELLHRMTRVSGDGFDPFKPLDSAAALLEKTGQAAAAEFLSALVKAEPWNWEARERLAMAGGSVSELTAVAKAADAPYGARVAAALGLRKLKGSALTGGDELALLSSSNALSEADVSKPYFYASRMEAAKESRDAAVRQRLLAGAVAIDRKDLAAKIELLRTAMEARHDALAVGIGQEVVGRFLGEETEFTSWTTSEFLGNLPDAERVEFARGLAEAHQRLGNLRAALLFYQIAQAIEPVDRIQRVLETVRGRVEINAKNEGRRPVVTDHLDQDRLVRARVTVR